MDATTERDRVELRAEPAVDRKEERGVSAGAVAEEVARLENSQAAGLLRLARQMRGAA